MKPSLILIAVMLLAFGALSRKIHMPYNNHGHNDTDPNNSYNDSYNSSEFNSSYNNTEFNSTYNNTEANNTYNHSSEDSYNITEANNNYNESSSNSPFNDASPLILQKLLLSIKLASFLTNGSLLEEDFTDFQFLSNRPNLSYREISNEFQSNDLNSDGELDLSEISAWLNSFLGLPPPSSEEKALNRILGENLLDNHLNIDRFRNVTLASSAFLNEIPPSENEIKTDFERIDRNSDGLVDYADIILSMLSPNRKFKKTILSKDFQAGRRTRRNFFVRSISPLASRINKFRNKH